MFGDPITIAIVLGVVIILLIGMSGLSIYLYWRGLDLAPWFAKKENLKKEIESLDRVLSADQAHLKELQTQAAIAKNTIDEGVKERAWLDDNQDTAADLRMQINDCHEDLKEIEDKKNKAAEELQQKNTELQQIGNQVQLLETEVKKVVDERLAEEQNLQNLRSEINSCITERDNLIAKCQSLQQDISELRQEIQELEKKIKDWEEKKDKLVQECAALDAQKKELENCEARIKNLRNQEGEIQGKIHNIEKQLHDQTTKLINTAPVDEKVKWEDLTRPVFNMVNKKNYIWNESNWLEDFKDNLEKCGIKFNPRIVQAFHTGLKVADYSPMVVLAGISGTGKSLLPRLYAKALGMNFLQIAVQPRWDNPQDMFGFYNYMEGRYKATELSRMLWQFDEYNNPECRELFKGKMPMNLILLDEMNLAKVEYYFSDMLSKLEVRRGGDLSNPDQRKNAEIEIDYGSSSQLKTAKRLLVGSNNLFVGTMNEDESTQSLSDKVIDRSNVLRFGKPKDLNVDPDIQKFESFYKADQYIDYPEWNKATEKHSSFDDRINGFVEKINDQLGKIGRPFAYRVSGAIRAYVNSYPDSGADTFNYAMADQIEMKVLPKLNGLEKDASNSTREVLHELGNIIEELNDAELLNAYNAAKDNSEEEFFQWRGVTR